MKHSERPLTIAANGEIVPKPYGNGRWHSPRRYACAHEGCGEAALILVLAGVDDLEKAHNCCKGHV